MALCLPGSDPQSPSDQSRGWARPADSCATRASHAPSIADLSRVRRVVHSDGSGRLLVLFVGSPVLHEALPATARD